jgi:hypothetical protein
MPRRMTTRPRAAVPAEPRVRSDVCTGLMGSAKCGEGARRCQAPFGGNSPNAPQTSPMLLDLHNESSTICGALPKRSQEQPHNEQQRQRDEEGKQDERGHPHRHEHAPEGRPQMQ